jgi:hypothetical protein
MIANTVRMFRRYTFCASRPTLPNGMVILPICHNLPMCGRYKLSRRKQVVEEYFDAVSTK